MQRQTLNWTAERQQRLIELYRTNRTMEEIARELSLPLDMIEERIRMLALEGDLPRHYS